MKKYLEQTENYEIKAWLNTTLKAYLKKETENMGEIEHIIDYLNARADKFERKGKSLRLKKMSYTQAKKLSEKWVKTMIKKANNIVETDQDTDLVIDFKDGMRLVKLKGENAFKREGKLMSHCVASYHGKSGIEVYSLRDAKNNPHCTIELNRTSDNINQIKGKGNGSIHPNYISYVLKTLKHFNKEVRESELSYLGYEALSESFFSFLLSTFPNCKYITYKGKNFIYNNQEFTK